LNAPANALDQLAAEAKAADTAPEPGAVPGAAPAPPVDLAREWSEIPAAVGAGLSLALPELAPVYSDAACLAWGEAMVPIAERYGWHPGKAWPWLRLLNASGALLVPTALAFRARIKAAQQPDQVEEPAPAP